MELNHGMIKQYSALLTYNSLSTYAIYYFSSRLEKIRKDLLQRMEDLKVDVKVPEALLQEYLSLLMGFIDPIDGKENHIRSLVKFKWSQSATGTEM